MLKLTNLIYIDVKSGNCDVKVVVASYDIKYFMEIEITILDCIGSVEK